MSGLNNPFQKAVKTQAKLRLFIAGPSGSGKTYTSLILASALAEGGKVALLDTEHGSASKYADQFTFDTLAIDDYHPDQYITAIRAAEKAGYGVLVIDSFSHAWFGKNGLLEQVDKVAARMKTSNTFAAWKEITPIQNRLVEAILASHLHIIATMRSKTEYVIERDEKTGRTVPRKVGMAPIQRDGVEYESDVFAEMDLDNNFIIQKTRCPALAGKVFSKPDIEVAAIMLDWLKGEPEPDRPKSVLVRPEAATVAKPNGKAQPEATQDQATEEQLQALREILEDDRSDFITNSKGRTMREIVRDYLAGSTFPAALAERLITWAEDKFAVTPKPEPMRPVTDEDPITSDDIPF